LVNSNGKKIGLWKVGYLKWTKLTLI
jgi:hypothetical protein